MGMGTSGGEDVVEAIGLDASKILMNSALVMRKAPLSLSYRNVCCNAVHKAAEGGGEKTGCGVGGGALGAGPAPMVQAGI